MTTVPLRRAAHEEDLEGLQSCRSAAPRIWALFARRPGDNAQVETLARASGLAFEIKRLGFRKGFEALPNLRRGGSLFSLTAETQSALRGPFPDVVIAAGKRAAPAALRIKAASGGRTRLVHLGRTFAPPDWFDLVITTPQYAMPAAPNVVENRLPLTPATTPAAFAPDPEIAALPRPRLLAIVGGSAGTQTLDAAAARRFASEVLERVRASGGSLMLATSPRTSPAAAVALREALERSTVPRLASFWGEGPNRYRAMLAAADHIIVTDDSVSMATEAAVTEAPTTLFALPRRFDIGTAAGAALERLAARNPLTRRACDSLVLRGLVSTNRDIGRFMSALAAGGLLDGGGAAAETARAELIAAAKRVAALAAEACIRAPQISDAKDRRP